MSTVKPAADFSEEQKLSAGIKREKILILDEQGCCHLHEENLLSIFSLTALNKT